MVKSKWSRGLDLRYYADFLGNTTTTEAILWTEIKKMWFSINSFVSSSPNVSISDLARAPFDM